MRLSRLLLAAATATVLLGVLVATASATRIESSATTLRAQFREVRFEGIFGSAVCQVTLEGSLHSRTIVKTRGLLIGYITSARLGPCAVGAATILTETLPWHVQYDSFEGTLPTITSIRTNVIGAAFRVRTNTGENCLSRSTAANPAVGTYNIAGGVINSANIGGRIPTGAECFGVSGTFSSDSGPVTVLNSTTRITVRLI
jgi:hypothetical protein